MKNIINKLLVLLLVLFVGISLTACDDNKDTDTTNKNVPYGTISNNEYAKVGNISISEKTLYDQMRANSYDYLIEELVKTIVKPNQYKVENQIKSEVKDEIKKIIDEQCYGTSDEESLGKMREATKKEYRSKFVDSMYLLGIDLENSEDGIYTDESYEHFLNQYAQKEYVRNLLLNDSNNKYYWNNEYYKNEDDKDVKNPYYVSEESIESAYNSNKNSDATHNVVIVGYETLAQAQAAFGKLNANELYAQDLVDLYVDRYGYKFEDGATTTIADDYFKLTDAQLAKYNSSLVSMIKNIEEQHDEDTDFTAKGFQQFGDTVYFVGVQGKKAEADYASLEGEAKTTAHDETLSDIIENKLTSSTISSIIFEELFAKNVVIYDYVFDALYSVENKNHTRLEAKDWKAEYNAYVAKIGDEYITVDSFYEKLEKLLGISTAMDYLTTQVLLQSSYANEVTDKELEENDKDFNSTMESFEADKLASNGLPASLGKDAFKFLYYGTTNNDEIKEFYKAQSAWKHYLEAKPDNYYQLIEQFGKNYVGYKNESETHLGQFFDLSVKHILLTVDYNGDGTPDDPEIFCKESGVEETALKAEIAKTMAVIVNEIH